MNTLKLLKNQKAETYNCNSKNKSISNLLKVWREIQMLLLVHMKKK